jgi:predicted CopG family antitoxin
MTLDESKVVIPMMEEMIHQIEEQQDLLDEVYQELKSSQENSISYQNQIQGLIESNNELLQLLEESVGIEEMQDLLEKQDRRIQELETENQQWRELSEKLNTENSLLQTQNETLLKLTQK